jgi:hypothetical protein
VQSFGLTAGGICTCNSDLNGKVKYVLKFIDGNACRLHFISEFYEIVTLCVAICIQSLLRVSQKNHYGLKLKGASTSYGLC